MEVRSLQIRVDFGLFYGTSFLPGARIFLLFALFPCNSTITISFYPLIFPGLTTFSGNPMYGIENIKDLIKEKESALKLEYAIPSGSGSVSVERRFIKPIDIRDYRALSAWLNFRSF